MCVVKVFYTLDMKRLPSIIALLQYTKIHLCAVGVVVAVMYFSSVVWPLSRVCLGVSINSIVGWVIVSHFIALTCNLWDSNN